MSVVIRLGLEGRGAQQGITAQVWEIDDIFIAAEIFRNGRKMVLCTTLIKDHFPCTYRGEIDAKGKGALDMYFVD